MSNNLTTLLKRAVVEDFSAHLVQLGFQPETRRHDFYPYRRLGQECDDLVEVQMDKYHRPKLLLNFGIVPSKGIVDPYGRFLDRTKVQVAHLTQNGRLYSWPYSIAWFSPNTFFGLRSPESSVKAEVAHLINVFRQVERWFETGESGPNIWIYGNPENAPNVRRKSMQERGVWPPEGWTKEDDEAVNKADAENQ